ncbi:hypothetical protein KM043_018300 [Ampulex compressa]|nr:hypothetical protein KM043_018300 [Ampulex compressa]
MYHSIDIYAELVDEHNIYISYNIVICIYKNLSSRGTIVGYRNRRMEVVITKMSTIEAAKDEINPYAYLERDDFTSEKYKIEGSGWLYVCFRSEECRQRAISTLNGLLWKNSKLSAQVAKPAPDPFVKRKLEEEIVNKNKRICSDDSENTSEEDVKSTTIPLWAVPYSEQLVRKQKKMRLLLSKMDDPTFKTDKELLEWISLQRKLHQGLPCELLPIFSSDTIMGYRNKCEFTIGKDKEGKKVIIGFRLSSYAAGSTAVGPIDKLLHIPESMKKAVLILEELVQNSGLPPFDPVNHSGYWRQVTARTTRSNDLMLIIGIHPQDLTADDLDRLKTQFKDFFESGKGAEACVTSLYFQTIDKKCTRSKSDSVLEHISGQHYIEETLLNMTFRVSPQAFFQVNTLGAEILYKAAIELAKVTKDTSLLDICCGTGTIGLSFAKHCGEVFGLEIVPDAIKDAKENAQRNGVTNCEFFVGKAEDILPAVIQRTTKSTIIAVVDPPRAGLHPKVLLTLRRSQKLSRLLYISCNPRAALKDVMILARPKSKRCNAEPLVPVKALAVDMFPHTHHCELILCLERLSKARKSTNS